MQELSLCVILSASLRPLSPTIRQFDLLLFNRDPSTRLTAFFLPSRALICLASQANWSSSLLRPRARPSMKPCRKLISHDCMALPQPARLRLSHKHSNHLQYQMGERIVKVTERTTARVDRVGYQRSATFFSRYSASCWSCFQTLLPGSFLFLKTPFSQSLGSESATHIMHWSLLQQREKCKNIRNKLFVLKQRLSWHFPIIIFMLYANLSPISLTYMDVVVQGSFVENIPM